MPTLVTIPFSHFCEKARWALDHARVAYREEGHCPGLHKRAVKLASGRAGSVPVLVLDGDGVLDDSPLIMRWADARATSDRKLLPSGGRERDEALALEHHLDVDFAPHVRRFAYFHILPDRARALALMRVATPPLEHTVVRLGFPLLRRLMSRVMRVDREHAMRSRDTMRAVFDAMSLRLADGRPFLMGDRFGVADLTFAALASPLLTPPEHPVRRQTKVEPPPAMVEEAARLRETPAGLFALRMYRDHRGG
ncbi:MAG TPA: glutathione S-transferase family protein [Polyangiaceae bacterium]|jgi:glutathione S-transferase